MLQNTLLWDKTVLHWWLNFVFPIYLYPKDNSLVPDWAEIIRTAVEILVANRATPALLHYINYSYGAATWNKHNSNSRTKVMILPRLIVSKTFSFLSVFSTPHKITLKYPSLFLLLLYAPLLVLIAKVPFYFLSFWNSVLSWSAYGLYIFFLYLFWYLPKYINILFVKYYQLCGQMRMPLASTTSPCHRKRAGVDDTAVMRRCHVGGAASFAILNNECQAERNTK